MPGNLREYSVKNIISVLGYMPEDYIDINIEKQHLNYYTKHNTAHFHVSTSQFGVGSAANSFKTPLGVHCITEKIGDGFPSGTIFKSRKSTGEIWHPGIDRENLILSRILRLKGLQPGINSGRGIDSYDRYIYIHGTNREEDIGTPISHGCICMKNDDIITLFDLVREGTIVTVS